MNKRWLLSLTTASALTLSACGAQTTPPTDPTPPTPPTEPAPPTDPTPPTDPAPPTEPSAVDFAVTPTPGVTVTERGWDTELNYSSVDWEAIYGFYDQDILAQGWQKVDEEIESGDYDADYIKDGLELDLSVDLEDGQVEVEIDIDEVAVTDAEYSLYALPGLTLNLFPDTALITREWDIDTDYATSDVAAVFAHYDGLLREQGWAEVSRDDEYDVTYQLGSATLELDVDLEDGDEVEVDIDIDQNG